MIKGNLESDYTYCMNMLDEQKNTNSINELEIKRLKDTIEKLEKAVLKLVIEANKNV